METLSILGQARSAAAYTRFLISGASVLDLLGGAPSKSGYVIPTNGRTSGRIQTGRTT